MRDILVNEYFYWLCELIYDKKYSRRLSYHRLLVRLHQIDFCYILEMDENRAEDGVNLRYRFGYEKDYPSDTAARLLPNKPCSMLEMMIALASRSEELMDDPDIGNRTGKWFWTMIVNLGLGDMDDDNFDKVYVDTIIERFMRREYSPDGMGGLFTFEHCNKDLRKVEIWYQMMWYLDEILEGRQ